MSIKILIPTLGESVTEATIAKWHKKAGEAVKQDELLVELETEKVTLEVNAPSAGVLSQVLYQEGSVVKVGDEIGLIEEGAISNPQVVAPNTPAAVGNVSNNTAQDKALSPNLATKTIESRVLSPSAQKIAKETGVDVASIQGTGKDGRITKSDVVTANIQHTTPSANSTRTEERVPMSRLRKTIAQRLKDSQNTAAILTTFNEIDMFNIIKLRTKYKEIFEKKHGIKLGFMSFFVKAAIKALKEIPAVNAQIDGDSIIYKNYYDIAVAVGTDQGLVVPVLRGADSLSFADTEKTIHDFGQRARSGKLSMSELTGGTFSITNGGVYGSLMSTPIINPPQSGILGMHKTMDRPVALDGKIEIRPMMYVALSYDHRMIDGREAVTFLVKIKEAIEDPERLLLDV
ncbi:MAG: 2-oxoglutarate dehydrogenase complex dihydrolipoyllysine-residue succinyltransferase [Alphaproteobacteria bacterium]|nr:2-oxoglutarate dehydrogenase complex dihydrolipoyllysine-residue succinyltransferase [Alphaproteobacteria bacterium]